MNSPGLPRALPYPVMIRRAEIQLPAMMVVVFSDPANTWQDAVTELLGENEAAYFLTLRFARR